MGSSYIVLIGICLVALYVLILNIGQIKHNKFGFLKGVCIGLLIFSMLRYITLIIYGNHPSAALLVQTRYFYLATSIGLTIPIASAIWYIIPFYRQNIRYSTYLLCFLPWIIFYVYVLVTQPTVITKGVSYGYQLQLVPPFKAYLAIVQGSFTIVIFTLALIGIFKYKNIQIRVQCMLLLIALVTLWVDGASFFGESLRLVPPFTLSEIGGFLAVYYAFKLKPYEIRGYQNNRA